jgi:hypothetical protein
MHKHWAACQRLRRFCVFESNVRTIPLFGFDDLSIIVEDIVLALFNRGPGRSAA